MFKANERCYKRTFELYGLEALNHRSELKILWDTFRSQIAELWFPSGAYYPVSIWSQDRKRSQKIEHGSIFCDRVRSRSQKCVSIWSQTIAELSAIWDPRSSAYWNQPLGLHGTSQRFETSLTRCLLGKKKRDKNCTSILCAYVPSKRKQRNVNECALFLSFAVGNDWPIFFGTLEISHINPINCSLCETT